MPVEHDMQNMWQIAADRRSVHLSLPSVPVAGLAEPIRVNIDLDTGVVDQSIERLTVDGLFYVVKGCTQAAQITLHRRFVVLSIKGNRRAPGHDIAEAS